MKLNQETVQQRELQSLVLWLRQRIEVKGFIRIGSEEI